MRVGRKWRERGTGTHRDRKVHTGKGQSDKEHLLVGLPCACTAIPGGQTSVDRSHMNMWEEGTRETVNECPEVGIGFDNPSTIYHFSVLRARF